MTVNLTPLIQTPSQIVCGCIGEFVVDKGRRSQALIVRADRSCEIIDLDSSEVVVRITLEQENIAAVTAAGIGEFATIDRSHSIQLHRIYMSDSGPYIFTIRELNSAKGGLDALGMVEMKYNCQFGYLPKINSFIFRSDRILTDMSLRRWERRFWLPPSVINMDSGKHKVVFNISGDAIAISIVNDALCGVLHKGPTGYRFYLVGGEAGGRPPHVDMTPEIGELIGLETFAADPGTESIYTVILIGLGGVAMYSFDLAQGVGSMRETGRYPIGPSTVLARMGDPPQSPDRRARINPGLNQFRKNSEVIIPQSISENLLALSLSGKESTVGSPRESSSVHHGDMTSCGRIGDCVYIFDRKWTNVFDMHSKQWESVRRASSDYVTVVAAPTLSTGILLHGSTYQVMHGVSSLSQQAMSSSPALSVVSLSDVGVKDSHPLIATLHPNELRFSFQNSAPSKLERDSSDFDFFHIFPFPHRECVIVATVGRTAVVMTGDPSHMAVAPFTTGDATTSTHPSLSVVDIPSNWGLVTDALTIGAYPMDGFVVQILEDRILVRGAVVWSGPTIVSHCRTEDDGVVILVSTGDVVDVSSDGAIADTWQSGVVDGTSIRMVSQSVVIGSFDGDLLLFSDKRLVSKSRVSCSSSIGSVDTGMMGNDPVVLATTRNGVLLLVTLDGSTINVHREFDLNILKIQKINSNIFLIFSYTLLLLDLGSLSVRSVELGHRGGIGSLGVLKSNDRAATLILSLTESSRLVQVELDLATASAVATYAMNLPFEATRMVVADDVRDPSVSDMYVLATLHRMHQAALFTLSLDRWRAGLVGTADAVSVSAVFPFDILKEEPVALAVWNHEMFPDGGLVVVGTRGKMRGRIVLFERGPMNVVAKTSVPSIEVSAVAELSPSLLLIGGEESIALLALRPGPPTMPAILSTVATFMTYAGVKHITRVDDCRFLAVTDGGFLGLLRANDRAIVTEAELETCKCITSACYVVPGMNAFVCSSGSELLLYSLEHEGVGTGLLRLIKSEFIGSAITSGCKHADALVLGTTNGSVFEVTSDARLINRSS